MWRNDVNDPGDVVVIADEPDGAQEVVDVDPADPLLARADAPAEAELGEVDETIERRGAVIEDDPGADLTVIDVGPRRAGQDRDVVAAAGEVIGQPSSD